MSQDYAAIARGLDSSFLTRLTRSISLGGDCGSIPGFQNMRATRSFNAALARSSVESVSGSALNMLLNAVNILRSLFAGYVTSARTRKVRAVVFSGKIQR